MTILKLEEDFDLFRNHRILIRQNYNTYNELFFSGNDDILIKTASTFFNDIAEILTRDWMLQVCKLMDSAQTKRQNQILENISIKLINKELEDNQMFSKKISDVSEKILDYGKKVTPARNKRLAHYDRDHQVQGVVLGETTEQELENFLINIQNYCDLVGNAIGAGPLDFSVSSCPGDVRDLIKVLKQKNMRDL